jgi:hemerythrin-like metal-binding protein
MAVLWSDDLLVGVESLDRQHKYLIGLLNDFLNATYAREFNENYQDLVCKLIKCYHDHFNYEEELMKKHQYPNFSEHETDHSQFMVLINMMSTYHNDEVNAPDSVARFLKMWISDHIIGKDKILGMYLKEKGVH